MIRTIEEISMNAWPAAQTVLLDGWVLRFSGGYTRRANCVTALYPGREDAVSKIRACEALYQAQNLPVVFKLPGRQESAELDQILAGEGYAAEAETCVQALNLRQWAPGRTDDICLENTLTDAWHAAFCRFSGMAENNQLAHRQIISAIQPQTGFAWAHSAGQVAACGLGVIQSGYLGVFDIVTGAEFRRLGCGEKIMRGLLSWAKAQGAHTAYLQVMLNNPPALALYAKLGFRELYQYWYRVKKLPKD
jgi:N-acetylglutamate synthase